MTIRPLTIFSFSVLLTLYTLGCTTVGPDYKPPTAPVKENWINDKDPLLESTPPVEPKWWKTAFNDPILDRLVEIALAQNFSLRSAGLRVLQARQQLAIAIGYRFPQQQQFTGSATPKILSNNANDIFPLLEDRFVLYDLGFNLSWEADVWGRFKRQIESASAALDASVASYDGIMVSLIAQVAQTYLLIRTTQQQLDVAKENLKYQTESVRITTAKFEGGDISSLDVEQATTLLYQTQAGMNGIELSLQQLKNSLAVLLGQPPQDMSDLLGKPRPIPTVASEVAVGMPQDLIRRRPDIRQAERQLAAQSAQIGFAVSELYPHFTLGGAIATSTTTIGSKTIVDLFDSDSFGLNLFGAFKWNVLQYGRLRNNVRLQDAAFQQLLEDYRQTVLQAQGEVENAIVAFFKSQEQLQARKLAAEAAQRAVDVSTAQYKDGLVNFNTVISTLKSLATQQDQLAEIQGTVATNLVDLYKSLGGGWEIRQMHDPLDWIPQETRVEMLERSKYWRKSFEKKNQSTAKDKRTF